jgi:hypothetical protein
MCVNGACRTGCVTNDDCCKCGDADICHGGFCVTAGEAAPVCAITTQCGSTQSCIDALCR